MPDSTEIGMLLCAAISFLVFGLPVPITSVVIAGANMDDPCQSMDKIGLSLANWLLGAGIVGLLLVISFVVLIFMMSCQPMAAGVTITVLLLLNSFFQLIYTTIGAVILFRSNSDCLSDGTDLGIMSLVVLIFYWLAMLCSCCGAKAKSSSN